MFAKETCFLLKWMYALFQLPLIIAHLMPRPKCNQSFLLEESVVWYLQACVHLAAPICAAPQVRPHHSAPVCSGLPAQEVGVGQGDSAALALKRRWAVLDWMADVLHNYAHIFHSWLKWLRTAFVLPPLLIKSSTLFALTISVEICKSSLDHCKKTNNWRATQPRWKESAWSSTWGNISCFSTINV